MLYEKIRDSHLHIMNSLIIKWDERTSAAAETYAQKFKENSDPDPQNAYLEASIKWASKNFDQAIAMSKDIISQSGNKANARVYKLIADAMVQKGDTVGAKPFIDEYFVRAASDELSGKDKALQATIYSAIPGQEDKVFSFYVEGVNSDTVIENKVDVLRQGATYFKGKGMREKEGDLLSMLIQIRPKTSLNDMFDATRAYYFGQAYQKSLDMSLKLIEKFPNEIYGYDWKVNNYKILDSSYTNNQLVPAAIELFEFAQKDTAKFKKQYMSSAGFLLAYYANEAKDKDKAVEYVNKMLVVDPTNASLLDIKDKLLNPPRQPATQPKKPAPKTGSNNNNKQPSSGNGTKG